MDDPVQLVTTVIGLLAGFGLSYALGWWARGDHERKRRDLHALAAISVVA
jgi:hypothetical protein